MKTLYCLRIRIDDASPWGKTKFFSTRTERDRIASFNRIIGGLRTYSFEEKVSKQQAIVLLAEQALA